MKSATKIDKAQTDSPRFIPNQQPLRRRLRYTLEAVIAVLVVASLVLGWFAVTKWRSEQGTGPTLFTYTSQPGEHAFGFRWTPDGKHLTFTMLTVATNQYRYRYLVWDAATGKARQTLTISIPYPTPNNPDGLLLNSLDGRYALNMARGAIKQIWTVKLANTLTGQVKLIYQGIYQGHDVSDIPAAAFSGDSKYVAFIAADERIHIWGIAVGKVIQTTDPLALSGTAGAQQLVWSTDDKRLMAESPSSGQLKRLQVWGAQTGHTILNIVETPAMSLFPSLLEPGGGFWGLSPDGTRILTYNMQKRAFTERESSTLKVLKVFSVQIGAPYTVFWEANGTRILLQSNQTAYIWNASTGKLVSTLSLKNTSQTLLIPSGTRYITRGQPGNLLEIWDMVTGTKVRTIALAISPLAVIWSPDGKYLNLNDGNNNGQIYDALSGHLITNYQGDGALLSPDGQYVATQKNLFDPQTNSFLQAIVQILHVP